MTRMNFCDSCEISLALCVCVSRERVCERETLSLSELAQRGGALLLCYGSWRLLLSVMTHSPQKSNLCVHAPPTSLWA